MHPLSTLLLEEGWSCSDPLRSRLAGVTHCHCAEEASKEATPAPPSAPPGLTPDKHAGHTRDMALETGGAARHTPRRRGTGPRPHSKRPKPGPKYTDRYAALSDAARDDTARVTVLGTTGPRRRQAWQAPLLQRGGARGGP